MRQMKASGIEWVGDIPAGWSVKPIRAEFEEVTRKNSDGEVKTALKFTYGTIVRKENFDADEDSYVADTILNYTVVTPGTIMLNGLNLNFDFVSQRIGLVKEMGAITSAYSAFRPSSGRITSEFATYLLKAYDGCKAFHNMGGGVRKILNFSELKRHYVVYPDVAVQGRIVEFLDARCAEIETIISEIQAQIDVLEQYKRSVVTETVTKGLNPDAEMKDSGIQWIGMIPAHWEIDKLKYHLQRNEPKNPGDQIILSLYRELGVIPKDSRDDNHNVTSEDTSKYKYVRPGDFVINKMKAWQGSVAVSDYEGVVSPAYYVYNFTDEIFNKRYFHYLLRGCYKDEFMRLSGGIRVGQWDLPSDALDNTPVLIPPVPEQSEIANFLDERIREVESIIEQKKEQLEVLDSYKKSLIFEYVTGKKEVPQP